MDKIETYIQNVFSGWPEAEVVTKTKSNLQSLMKTHYERLDVYKRQEPMIFSSNSVSFMGVNT